MVRCLANRRRIGCDLENLSVTLARRERPPVARVSTGHIMKNPRSSTRLITGAIAVLAATLAVQSWSFARAASGSGAGAAQVQEPGRTYPVPTVLPETLKVAGSVSVTDLPPVFAQQMGVWNVDLVGRPEVVVAAPTFLQVGVVYRFRWAHAAAPEAYRMVEIRADGWVLGELWDDDAKDRPRRWVNPALAATIEQAQ
jgi:hypothetical protein